MDEPVRVLILTADFGFGHRNAANAIAAALRESYGKGCQVEVVNPLDDKRAPLILRDNQADYDKQVSQMRGFYKLQYQFSDATIPVAILEKAFTVMLFKIMGDIVQCVQPHVVLSTHTMFAAPLHAYISLRRLGIPFLNVVTDLTQVHRLWFNDDVDLCLVPTDEVYQQALACGLVKEQIRITGIPVHPDIARQTRPPEAIRAKLGWAPGMTTALVVGSKRVKNLTQVLHVLNHSGLPLQLVVVAGGDDELFSQLQDTDWHAVTHIYNYVENMPAFLRAADLVISKAGGLIATEALACGLPILIVDVTPGQEPGNADYIVRHGVGELAGEPIKAREILTNWLDRGGALLAERARNAAVLGQPRSAYQVAELAWQAAERGRSLPTTTGRLDRVKKLRDRLSSFGIST
jgi:1,2-diacylglycerol 3-beta-galactosyltransferase